METLEQIALRVHQATNLHFINNDMRDDAVAWSVEFARRIVAELSSNGVLIKIHIPEGYEDVHPELVAEDAMVNSLFGYDVVSAMAAEGE